MKFALGLTGSIGMGKSTTAQMFVEYGCVLWDADAAVHALYSVGGAAVPHFEKEIPEVVANRAVSRELLKEKLRDIPSLLSKVEAIVHPLVTAHRQTFREQNAASIGVFDIPLLFETQAEGQFDAVACVYVSAKEQKKRVMARGTMTEDQFHFILSKQMPIEDKLEKAHYRICTDTMRNAQEQVEQLVSDIKEKVQNA